MSEIHDELLGRGVSTKRIIGVIAVAGLLIGVFVFQTTLFSVILGTEKVDANEELEYAPLEDPQLFLIPPPFDLEDLLAMLNPDQLASLMDMLDGQIDDLDLEDYAAMLAALLVSEVEVFRIYNYDNINQMNDTLWKYEAFDSYDGSTWSTSASPALTTFADYNTYYNTHQAMGADLLKLQRVLTPSVGTNSLVAGTIFSDPLIMDSSIVSVNTTNLNEAASALYVDDFNCSVLELTFTSTETAKIEYELYGLPATSDADTLNTTSVDESFTPIALQNQYLLLPPSIAAYRSNNDDFDAKCTELEAIIHPGDNAFQVANKIRNYLQINFTGGLGGLQIYNNNPPADGQDGIEWFCEQEGGLWIHFASAYTAFCRVFGVASRFIDGFNSRNIEEENDGNDYFAIKYKNIYNWAEVYIPTNIDGSGTWVQVDVQYESYDGGAALAEGNFTLEIEVDNSVNNTIYCERDEYLKFKATLNSPDSSVEGRRIQFFDTATQTILGEATTDVTGVATTYIQFDSSLVVGPHFIGAYFQGAINSTLTFLVDEVAVALYSATPKDVDRATPNNFTIVTGNIYDPNHDNFDPIENATLNFVLLQNGTTIRVPAFPQPAFTPNSVITDEDGDFSIEIYVNNGSLVPNDEYEVRVDFNGTWNYDVGDLIFPLVNGSSNKQPLNVTGFIDKQVWLYLDGFEKDNFNSPEVNRWDSVNLTAKVINETTGLPILGENVSFYDYTQGGIFIGNDFTDINGIASINYVGDTNSRMPGPNLVYAMADPVVNHSYFIVNDSSQITINVQGPDPVIINRTSPGVLSFNVQGNITGNINNDFLRGAYVRLKMYKYGFDNSTYLDPNPMNYLVGADGTFSFDYEVDDDTPQGNYTLIVQFDGAFNHNWGPYPYNNFYIPNLNKSMAAPYDLRILASDIFIFDFWINDTTSDNFNAPVINRDEFYELKTYLQGGADPLIGERVDFYDISQNMSLGFAYTDILGYAVMTLQANWSMVAGPHLIRAIYDGVNTNDSYYILNDQINVNVFIGPTPNSVDKSGIANRQFYIEGQVRDVFNNPVPFPRLTVKLLGPGDVDYSAYLLPQGGDQAGNYYYCNQTGDFNASYYVHPSIPAGVQLYYLKLEFNGTFIYGQPYPHVYNLIGWNNFSTSSVGLNNLTVTDPDQISIIMKESGSYLGSTFTDGNPPITVKRGDMVYLEVNVTRSGIAPVALDQLIVRDVFADVNISTYTFPGATGYVVLNISTAGNHSGLHKWELIFKDSTQKVYDTTNSTYVLINETVTIGSSLGTPTISRGADSWSISGTVSDGGQNLKALEINIFLLDASLQDKSYLLSVVGGRTKVINIDGTYSYSGTVSVNALHGLYYLVVNTTGGIQSTDAPLAISMVDANTLNSTTGNVAINITAQTDISNEVYWTGLDTTYPWLLDQWIQGALLFVNGTLKYENGTAMVGVYLRVRVELLDSTVIASGISTATDANGNFTTTIDIDSAFPRYRAQTRIFIEFHGHLYGNNEVYVEQSEQEVLI